jgi:glycosidase
MRWDSTASAGFSSGAPWLPVHADADHQVSTQSADPASMLSLVRALISLRRTHLSDAQAHYRQVGVDDHGWQFDSGPLRLSANFSGRDVPFQAVGTTILSSRTVAPHGLDVLAPWEAVVVLRG